MEPVTLLLLAIVILGAAFAGYMIGRWSVLTALEDVANRLDPDSPGLGPAGAESPSLAPGPAPHSDETWQRKPVTRSAKPPPVLAGDIGQGGGSNPRKAQSGGARKPPASAG